MLRPESFITRCTGCNGIIYEVECEEERRTAFLTNKSPVLEELTVWKRNSCSHYYWWSEQPHRASSRLKLQVERLFRLALQAGVSYEGDLHIFGHVNVDEERAKNDGSFDSKLEALEWLKKDELTHDFSFRSAYSESDVEFTDVTDEFVRVFDYVFYEEKNGFSSKSCTFPRLLRK